ncbi:hypothetical protein M2266_002315 [Streptomyces sp. SPB162]|nr:hypothetical protein [Streptomyces sp. SPB162]
MSKDTGAVARQSRYTKLRKADREAPKFAVRA